MFIAYYPFFWPPSGTPDPAPALLARGARPPGACPASQIRQVAYGPPDGGGYWLHSAANTAPFFMPLDASESS